MEECGTNATEELRWCQNELSVNIGISSFSEMGHIKNRGAFEYYLENIN